MGTQIDLMFDQSDSITLCEIKYTEKFFTIDKSNYIQLLKKSEILKKITKTQKQIFLALISANTVIPSYYSEEMSGIVTATDLF